ncbi:probable pectate lyase 5 [Quercus robur]|uniref:probable pectate lyase 5 n=1 Tax=Quercus robur TaxID=38942 RepID=UPI002162B365|nr:probable pectate lyase 5 [Quercus robur]
MASCSLLSLITILFTLLIPTLIASRPVKDEFVAKEVQRNINASLTRRNLKGDSSCSTGNPIDDCWKCDSNWNKNRQKLADCAVGFGKNAAGGKDGKIYVVTDSNDNDAVNPKNGTLRHAVIQDEPLWIIFESDMTIKLKVELIMNSYKTIDGRGANVHITGGGCITIQDITNVIIHGINIHDCKPSGNTNVRSSPGHFGHRGVSDGDAMSIFGSKHVWVDHVTLSKCDDGLVDVVEGSSLVTISNSLFTQHDKVILLGHADDYTADKSMKVTIAFNHFGEGLTQRLPRVRHGYVHVVNNYYTKWKMYAIGGSASPTILSQGNKFVAPDDEKSKEVTKYENAPKSEWHKWNWKSEGDEFLNGAFFTSSSGIISSSNATFFTSSSKSSSSSSASDITAKASSLVPKLTANAGALKCNKGSAC